MKSNNCTNSGSGRVACPRTVLLIFIILVFVSSAHKTSAQEQTGLLEIGKASRPLQPNDAATEFLVVTYNIRWRTGAQLDQIGEWLKKKGAVVIALQEVDRARKRTDKINHARVLAEKLGMYYAWAAPPPPKSGEESEEETGVALLSPYPLADVTRIVLPHHGPGGRWRVALGATVKIGKTDLRVYSMHSETRIPIPQKIDQMRAVLDDLARLPKTTAAIVMGDFNSWEPATVEQVRELFTGEGFTTPFADADPTFKRDAVLFDLTLKLDWIWLRGLMAKTSGLDLLLTVSDHFPLWTVVSFPPKSNGSAAPGP